MLMKLFIVPALAPKGRGGGKGIQLRHVYSLAETKTDTSESLGRRREQLFLLETYLSAQSASIAMRLLGKGACSGISPQDLSTEGRELA